jgi:hypothetical protein
MPVLRVESHLFAFAPLGPAALARLSSRVLVAATQASSLFQQLTAFQERQAADSGFAVVGGTSSPVLPYKLIVGKGENDENKQNAGYGVMQPCVVGALDVFFLGNLG